MGGSSNGISDCDRKNTFTHDVQTHKTTVGRSGDDVKGSQPNGTQNHHNLLDEVHNRENEYIVNYSVQPEKIVSIAARIQLFQISLGKRQNIEYTQMSVG